MFINPLSVAQGAIELFSELTSHKDKKEEKDDNINLSNALYDINHISVNDLNALVLNLTQKGTLSENDSSTLLKQVASIQQSNGISKDTKVDMIQLYQQQLQKVNATANPKEVASLQHSLDLLNGLKARSGASIPQAV